MNENEIQVPAAAGSSPSGTVPPSVEQRITEAMANKAYMDGNHADHVAVVRQVRELHLQQEREERGEPAPKEQPDDGELLDANDPGLEELPPTSELARQCAVDIPDLPEAAGGWVDSAMGDFLSWCLDENLSKGSVQSVLSDYADWLVIAGRSTTGERPGDAEQWMDRLKGHGLSEKQAKRLIAWHRANTK